MSADGALFSQVRCNPHPPVWAPSTFWTSLLSSHLVAIACVWETLLPSRSSFQMTSSSMHNGDCSTSSFANDVATRYQASMESATRMFSAIMQARRSAMAAAGTMLATSRNKPCRQPMWHIHFSRPISTTKALIPFWPNVCWKKPNGGCVSSCNVVSTTDFEPAVWACFTGRTPKQGPMTTSIASASRIMLSTIISMPPTKPLLPKSCLPPRFATALPRQQ